MANKRIRVAVTGAAGQIGYALVFRIASGQMFGSGTDVEMSLLELEAALPALKGVVMELEDCAFPLLKSVTISSDCNVAFKSIDWALLVGSVPRKAGMERNDLLKINGGIFTVQGQALSNNAKSECKVLVVGNPCNTNAWIAKASAPKLNPKNFFAMTMLDQNRACAQLAKKAGVDVTAIKNVAVWGNHSSTQYPDFYHAAINGRPVIDTIKEENWLQNDFIKGVQQRGAEILKARGLSSAASAANAVIDTVRALTTPTPRGEYFSAAVTSDESYGITPELMFSFPLKSDGKNWSIVSELKHNTFAQEKIRATHEELLSERDAVRQLIK